MPASVYMLSILARQQLLLEADFAKRYAHGWLVWEPGPWRPARTEREANVTSTLPDEERGPARPSGMDALCFALEPPHITAALSIGRDSSNDLVVNDLTFSRHALRLFHAAQGWTVELHGDIHGEVMMDGMTMRPGSHVALFSGNTLTSGAVTLRYYDVEPFIERLRRST